MYICIYIERERERGREIKRERQRERERELVTLSFSSGMFLVSLKEALVHPLVKKILLDRDIFKHYRPVSNLVFVSKVMGKAAMGLYRYMDINDLIEIFQGAYRELHSTETGLAIVHNDKTNIYDMKATCPQHDVDTVAHRMMIHLQGYKSAPICNEGHAWHT